MKLHGCNAASIGYSSNPEEPEPDRRQEYIRERTDAIWDDPCLLEEALDCAGIPFSYETVRLLSACLQAPQKPAPTNADRFVLALAADMEKAVVAAATSDVDNGLS